MQNADLTDSGVTDIILTFNIPVMQLMHHSEFDLFKMASRLVANPWEPHLTCRHVWWICNIPDVLPDGDTNTCI